MTVQFSKRQMQIDFAFSEGTEADADGNRSCLATLVMRALSYEMLNLSYNSISTLMSLQDIRQEQQCSLQKWTHAQVNLGETLPIDMAINTLKVLRSSHNEVVLLILT